MELRWIKRDGEMVLQYRQFLEYGETSFTQWIDVHTVEEQKTEREKVCDEIIDHIKTMSHQLYTGFEFMQIIYEIRNRQ
jgi:hypothetical protein